MFKERNGWKVTVCNQCRQQIGAVAATEDFVAAPIEHDEKEFCSEECVDGYEAEQA